MTWDMFLCFFLGSNMKGHFILQCLDSNCWGTSHLYLVSGSFASFVWGYRFGWRLHFRFHLVTTMFLLKLPPKFDDLPGPKTCWDVGSSSMGYIWLPFTQVIRDSPGCQPPHSPGTRNSLRLAVRWRAQMSSHRRMNPFRFWIYYEGMILLPHTGVLDSSHFEKMGSISYVTIQQEKLGCNCLA